MSGLRTSKRHFAKGINGTDRYTPVCGENLSLWEVAPVPVLDWSAVTCPACIEWLATHPVAEEDRGVEPLTPLQIPPYMNDRDDGVFTFHDVHLPGCTLEVVPQLSGNLEITISYGGDGHFMTLSHLDRADLLRAVLHDFHYSPERGGPNDQD